MKLVVAQPDFQFADKLRPSVLHVLEALGMKNVSSVSIDIDTDTDSLEIFGDADVKLSFRPGHFLDDHYKTDKWNPRKIKMPACAFSKNSLEETLFRLLLQWRDVLEWGIPRLQNEEFLCIWNVHVAGRLAAMHAPHASKDAHWEEYCRVFAAGKFVPLFCVLFEMLWKCEHFGHWGLNDVLHYIRNEHGYHCLTAKGSYVRAR